MMLSSKRTLPTVWGTWQSGKLLALGNQIVASLHSLHEMNCKWPCNELQCNALHCKSSAMHCNAFHCISFHCNALQGGYVQSMQRATTALRNGGQGGAGGPPQMAQIGTG